MNRWSGGLLRFIFAFIILFLALLVSVWVRAILHSQSDRITGIAFLIAVVCLVLSFERIFPSVYATRRPTPFWQTRAVAPVAFAIIITILSSRIATLWFGALVVSSVLVALLLRASRRDNEF